MMDRMAPAELGGCRRGTKQQPEYIKVSPYTSVLYRVEEEEQLSDCNQIRFVFVCVMGLNQKGISHSLRHGKHSFRPPVRLLAS
jgi:hypothetical protein